MLILNSTLKYFSIVIFLTIYLFPQISVGQELNNTKLDSIISTKTINVADITIELSEADFEANITINNLKNDNSLIEFKKDNDSIVKGIRNDLKLFSKEVKSLSKKNNRRLNNTLVYWEQDLATINDRISDISNRIGELDKKINDLSKEKNKSILIIYFLKKNNESYSIQNKAKSVKSKIDKITKDLSSKKNYSVKILEKLINTKSLIVPIIDNINTIISDRKTNITHLDHKSYFKIDYLDKEKWKLSSIKNLLNGEYNRLATYALDNVTTIILHFLIIIATILFFIYLKNNPINDITTKPTLFKLYFRKLINMPKSLGTSIGLLLFIGLYNTPPLVFIDIYRFLFAFPILILLGNTLNKKFLLPLNLFFAAMTVQMVYTFIPEETIYSRILLLALSVLETWLVIWLILYQRTNEIFDKKLINKVVITLLWLYLLVALTGVIGNIAGMVAFTEIINANIINSFLVILLMSLLFIASNGIIISFLESETSSKINFITNNRPNIIKNTTRIANITVTLLFLYLITSTFGIEQQMIESFVEVVKYPISLGSITFSISGIFTFFFVIWMSIIISNTIKGLLEEDILNKMNVEDGLINTISMTVKYSIIAIGFFTAISAAGIPLNQMAIVFSAFGVGIGFGLQNIFNNLVSGFILLFERPIKIGDTVEVGTLIGQVKSIGIRSSKVRTFDGAEIIVPNGNLISNEVINWTLSDRKRRVEIIVGISYDSDPHVARDIFIGVLKKHKQIVSNPEPNVYFRDLGESSLDFRLLFWTYKDWIEVRSDIMFDVFDALKEAGIEIPFPQQDLHLRSIDPNVEVKHKSGERRKL